MKRNPGKNAASELERRVAWAVTLVPLAGFVLALVRTWRHGSGALEITLCLGFALVTLLGITAGYHRLFAHHSFKSHASLRWGLGILGSMAVQGPLLFWVACHRRHHQYSDLALDPHSPRQGGDARNGWLRGLWHAHLGWMFHHEPEPWGRYVPDLLRDELAFRIHRTYPLWVILGLALPAGIGGAVAGAGGVLSGFLWGGLVRVFLVHHITWSINSLCHCTGGRPYDTNDDSRNNFVCAVLALGEGWHNNHHAFPTSARHGLEWWQIDATYVVIRLLSELKLVWDVNLPPAGIRARKSDRVPRPASSNLPREATYSPCERRSA
jgi:stearoyl-CoA desaturase (delta-9 desaturase)